MRYGDTSSGMLQTGANGIPQEIPVIRAHPQASQIY